MSDINKIIIDGVEFESRAAVTESEQMLGLMYEQWPPPVMFFPYKNANIRRFWMKNTVSPLDIIFCRAGRVVAIFDGVPMSTAMVGPNEPSDLVVELPKGTAKKHGFTIGSFVKVKYSTETAAKVLLTEVY